ncbi:MAG: hypothetical protein ACXIU8_16120 [Alkalilacustris sp.]
MGSVQPRQTAEITGWLDTVQRDPRTLGAFRQRIEALLTDPAVARRVRRRLLEAEAHATHPDGHDAAAARRHDRQRPTARLTGATEHCRATPAPAMTARTDRMPTRPTGGADRLGRWTTPGCGAGATIIGCCDCRGACRLMVPDLRRFGAGAGATDRPPVLSAPTAGGPDLPESRHVAAAATRH